MNFSTADFSMNDRKKLLFSHFEHFQGTHSDFTIDELYDFLDKKIGKPFDRNIGDQISEIIRGENERMNLSDFINQYIDTEDTLSFRIDLDKKRIEELIMQKEGFFAEKTKLKNQYEQSGEFLKLYSLLKLYIREASNLESKAFNAEVNSIVKIIAGTKTFHTVRVEQEKNPEYKQEFDMVLKEDLQEIRIEVYDSPKPGQEDLLGFVRLGMEETSSKPNDERSEYLMREDGLRTRSKIVFSYKIVPSKIKEFDEQTEKLDQEIKEIEQVMKGNQKALFLLREPFSSTFQPFQNQKQVKNGRTIEDLEAYNRSEELETNDDNEETGRLTRFEEVFKGKLEALARKIGVKDWQNVILVSTCIFIAFALFVSFLRSTFYDVMLVALILLKARTDFERVNFLFMRILLILMSFSLVMDFIWLIFYTNNWEEENYESELNSLKSFVIVLSFFQFFYKFYYGLVIWRCAAYLGEFKTSLKNFGFNQNTE